MPAQPKERHGKGTFLASGVLTLLSPASVLTIFSAGSVFSAYSLASFGSIGSVMSICSVSSVLSVFSVGCVLSVNTVCFGNEGTSCCVTQSRRATGLAVTRESRALLDPNMTAWVGMGQSNSDCHLHDGFSNAPANTFEYYGGRFYAFHEPPFGCEGLGNSPYGALAELYGGNRVVALAGCSGAGIREVSNCFQRYVHPLLVNLTQRFARVAVLYHQGESDALVLKKKPSAFDYTAALQAMIDAVPETEWFVSRASCCMHNGSNEVRAQQWAVKRAYAGPDTDVDMPCGERPDKCHFGSTIQIATLWKQALEAKRPLPLP